MSETRTSDPGESRADRRIGPAGTLGLLALVLCARLAAIRVCHVYDDAFITYRYAANLAAGRGLLYHPGAAWEPVLGTTAPGYAVWLAGWIALGVDAVRASLATNVLCDLGSALLLLRILGRRPIAAALAVLFFACMPELARVSAGGMEAPALCVVVLGASLALAQGRSVLAALLATLACTLRPEAVLLAALLGLHALREHRPLRFLVPLAIGGGLVALALTLGYGSPIPQSVIAKASRHADAGALATVEQILTQAFLPHVLYLTALPFIAIGMPRALRSALPISMLVRFSLAIVLSYGIARPHTWGWYYYVPLTSWAVSLALGLEWCWHRLGTSSLRARLENLAPYAALVLGSTVILLGTGGRSDRVSERVYAPLREWAREADLATARVLASDIGALGWYGRGVVLDTEGLVWPPAVSARGAQLEIVRAERPEYAMITATRGKIAPLRADEGFAREYVAIRRFSVLGETELEPPLEALPENWVQDYIVYARKDR